MAPRLVLTLASCCALAGCGNGSSFSLLAFPKLPDMLIPEIQLMGVPLYGEKPGFRLEPTTPYLLSPAEETAVRSAVAKSFQATTDIVFFPLKSGITDAGTISVCGMVAAHRKDGATESRLFRGDLIRRKKATDFSVKKISGGNANSIDVYGDCQAQGLA